MTVEGRVAMGPFDVDPTGALFARDGDAPPCFGFAWRDRQIEARLIDDVLRVVARVGRVPSSAENVPRVPAFETLKGLPRTLPASWKVTVEPSHVVRIAIDTRLEGKLTAATLLTTLTSQMLELAPYLDLLEQAGVGERLARQPLASVLF